MNATEFWLAVEQKSLEIGFSEIAAVQIEDLAEEKKYLDDWLVAGFDADMEYMKNTKEVRKNPKLFLEGVRSVMVGTVSYYQEYKNSKNTGKIARYAAGRDYHKVMKKMLFELKGFLQQQVFPNTSDQDFRISLDVHPVMERAWAQKSKLGFLGKNSCLITEKAGSWVMIGAILTTQIIHSKSEDRKGKTSFSPPRKIKFSELSCGICTRCIDICPTQAIVAPGKIDARKCISYLTIENKGGIPLELREQIGDRLFGCDICQEVCPFNIPRQKKSTSPLMEKEIAGTEVLIAEILQIRTEEEFLRRFAGSPLTRAKRRGLLRNACVVAGNLGNKEFLPLLQKIVDEEDDEMLKEHAQWGINEIKDGKFKD